MCDGVQLKKDTQSWIFNWEFSQIFSTAILTVWGDYFRKQKTVMTAFPDNLRSSLWRCSLK